MNKQAFYTCIVRLYPFIVWFSVILIIFTTFNNYIYTLFR